MDAFGIMLVLTSFVGAAGVLGMFAVALCALAVAFLVLVLFYLFIEKVVDPIINRDK